MTLEKLQYSDDDKQVRSDYVLAADQFGELCKADLWPRLIFGVIKSVSDAEIDRVIDGAVQTFLARYGA